LEISLADLAAHASADGVFGKDRSRNGRLGAAHIVVGSERDGLHAEASHYRKVIVSRRLRGGECALFVWPKAIDRTQLVEAITRFDDGHDHRAMV
jgi:hypothetical protein